MPFTTALVTESPDSMVTVVLVPGWAKEKGAGKIREVSPLRPADLYYALPLAAIDQRT